MNNTVKNPPFSSYKTDTYNLDVAVALLPVLVWAHFMFGYKTLGLVITGVVSCVLLEIAVNMYLYKKIGGDVLGAVVVGLLIPLSLNAEAPVWAVIVASASAMILAKYPLVVFGKKGSIFSPAALGMLVGALVSGNSSPFLDGFRSGIMPEDSLLNIFIGNTDGALGTVSVLLLALVGIYLLIRRAISFNVVLSSAVVFVALSLAFYPEWTTYTDNMIYQLLCGGFLFYLIFAACDRSGVPFTSVGKLIYGAGFALLAFVLRCYTPLAAPEALGVLIMNIITPLLDAFTKPVPFGGKRK